jgi:hypothetical protein
MEAAAASHDGKIDLPLAAAAPGLAAPVGQATKDDSATRVLFTHLLSAIAELEKDPAFIGFMIDETRDKETNRLVAITLCPCDDIGGNAARRF